MKKLTWFVALFMCCFFSGCSFTKVINSTLPDSDNYVVQISEEVIRCFNEKNIALLKRMFSYEIALTCDLDSQISYAFSQFNGEVTSYYITDTSMVESSVLDSEYVLRFYAPKIADIDTDSGYEYSIEFAIYEVYDDMPERVGIDVISLHDSEGNIIAIIGGENETQEPN